MRKVSEREFRNIGFSDVAARLLENLTFYTPKSQVRRDGKTWVVFTMEVWCRITDLTVWKYKKALSEVRGASFVTVERHLYRHKADGKDRPCLFMCVNEAALFQVLADNKALQKHTYSQESYQSKISRKSANQNSRIPAKHKYNLVVRDKEESSVSEYQEGFRSPIGFAIYPATVQIDQEGPMKADEVKKKMEDMVASKMEAAELPPAQGDKPSALYAVWKKAASSPGNYVAPKMPNEAIGCLKKINGAVPAGKASEILQTVATNWSAFVHLLTEEFGAYKLPASPMLGVVSKYSDQAVTFWQKQIAEAKQQTAKLEKQKAVQSIAPAAPAIDPAQIEAWVKEEFDPQFIKMFGPIGPNNQAQYAKLYAQKSKAIKTRVEIGYKACLAVGKPYPGPLAYETLKAAQAA